MENVFDKIKSIFIVTDPAAPGQENQAPRTAETPPAAQTQNSTSRPVAAPKGVGQPTADLTDMLLKAIESKNIEGFDYLEFKNSLKSLDKMIPDESTRYKSAFEMGKTMGLTKDALLKYAGVYIDVLEAERKKFNEAVENQKSTRIQERAQQMDEMEAQIGQKQELIKKLQSEIEQINQSLGQVKKEIEESAGRIDLRNSQFQASFSLVYNQIAEDIEKIKRHIQ
jgi:hypothetical protein